MEDAEQGYDKEQTRMQKIVTTVKEKPIQCF